MGGQKAPIAQTGALALEGQGPCLGQWFRL